MELFEKDKKSILKRMNSKKKLYYAPLIHGHILSSIQNFFSQQEFNFISLPSLNKNYISRTWELNFELQGQRFELTTSNAMQLSAMSSIYDKVYSITHAYRKEDVSDHTHLLEFNMLEVEWRSSDEEELFDLISHLLSFLICEYNKYIEEHQLTHIFTKQQMKFPIARITYEDALLNLKNIGANLIFDDYGFCDFDISNHISEPTIVTYYPPKGSWRAKRKDANHSYIYNLVLPNGYGELVEFSIRETNADYYKRKFSYLGYSEIYSWYLEAISHNQEQRVGFGLGVERLCSWLMELTNIQDQLCFPRTPDLIT